MKLSLELETFKMLITKSFNRQLNCNIPVSEFEFIPQNPQNNEVGRYLVVTKNQEDDVRLLISIISFAPYSDVELFKLQLLPNYCAGDNRDEVYVTRVLLCDFEFPEFRRYLSGSEYKDLFARSTNVLSQDGRVVKTQSGFPISTQNF